MIRALVLAFLAVANGCVIGIATTSVTPAPDCCVTLVIVVNPGLFAPTGAMSVDLWNAAQLDDLDSNARCAAVPGPGGTQFQCPPGVTYKEVVPERIEIPIASLGTSFEVTPKRIGPGEKFRIHLSGPSRDRCNLSSADLVQTAERGRTVLRDFRWQTTARGCITPP